MSALPRLASPFDPRPLLMCCCLGAAALAQVDPAQLGERRQVAAGVWVRQAVVADAGGRSQCVTVLDVDPDTAGVRLELARCRGLDETSDVGRRAGATAAINGGFFTKQREPDGLLRIAGTELAPGNPRRTAAIVLDAGGRPALRRDPGGMFAGAPSALAAGPLLLTDGELPSPRQWSEARHPRSAVGIDAAGRLLLLTVDGRTQPAAGMTLAELAETMRRCGCREAMNLDGGGSTTLWLQGAPGSGVLNHPCDDERFDAAGERGVADVLLVFAPPLPEPGVDAAERARRIDLDFALTRPQLLQQLQRRVRDFAPAELDGWIERGLIDHRGDGEAQRFLRPAVSNLFFRDAAARGRRLAGSTWTAPPLDTATRTFTVTVTLTVDADAVPAGETVRAWLPFPQQYEQQHLLGGDDTVPDAPMRALYQEQVAVAGEPVRFTTRYGFERRGVRGERLDPALARLPLSAAFTEERPPHVVFTPQLRRLAADIAGDETNPLLLARRLFDWCADHLGYSYAREYSTIACIPAAVLDQRRGDCGQLTLLFMTLCRCRGIPCRWQSGWVIQPGRENMHDWCEIRIEPWGWIPVDVNTAVELNHADGLTDARRQAIRDFCFGSLDSYRLVVNRDHARPLLPQRHAERSDDVDFQRGEVEWGTPAHNLYFDRFHTALSAELQR